MLPILSIILFLPVVGVGLMLLTPPSRPSLIRWIAVLDSGVLVVLSGWLLFAYDYGTGGFQFEERAPWVPSLGVSYHLAVDGITVPLVLLTAIVIFCGSVATWKLEDRPKEFYILLFVLVTGVFGVFEALDLFMLFFFYELAVLPMYPLIAVWGSTRREYGAMKLTLMLVAGSVLIWVALLAAFVAAGARSFDLLDLQAFPFDPAFQNLFFFFFMIGFGVLAGLWPFHTWSPDGHAAAPTAVSMLHAGVLMKLGAFGIIVAMRIFPTGAQTWLPVLVVLGTINVLWGAVTALHQRDLKYVTGYSSVSHMGYVLVGLGTLSVAGVSGAVLQMFAHGIMTALFFLLIGAIYDTAHTREFPPLTGLARRMPIVATFFVVGGFASLGLPGLSGFAAEFLVFVGAFQTYPLIGALGIVGAALTAVYVLRMLARLFFGPIDERWDHLSDANRTETLGGAILVAWIVIVGVYPALLVDRIQSSVEPLLRQVIGT